MSNIDCSRQSNCHPFRKGLPKVWCFTICEEGWSHEASFLWDPEERSWWIKRHTYLLVVDGTSLYGVWCPRSYDLCKMRLRAYPRISSPLGCITHRSLWFLLINTDLLCDGRPTGPHLPSSWCVPQQMADSWEDDDFEVPQIAQPILPNKDAWDEEVRLHIQRPTRSLPPACIFLPNPWDSYFH